MPRRIVAHALAAHEGPRPQWERSAVWARAGARAPDVAKTSGSDLDSSKDLDFRAHATRSQASPTLMVENRRWIDARPPAALRRGAPGRLPSPEGRCGGRRRLQPSQQPTLGLRASLQTSNSAKDTKRLGGNAHSVVERARVRASHSEAVTWPPARHLTRLAT